MTERAAIRCLNGSEIALDLMGTKFGTAQILCPPLAGYAIFRSLLLLSSTRNWSETALRGGGGGGRTRQRRRKGRKPIDFWSVIKEFIAWQRKGLMAAGEIKLTE